MKASILQCRSQPEYAGLEPMLRPTAAPCVQAAIGLHLTCNTVARQFRSHLNEEEFVIGIKTLSIRRHIAGATRILGDHFIGNRHLSFPPKDHCNTCSPAGHRCCLWNDWNVVQHAYSPSTPLFVNFQHHIKRRHEPQEVPSCVPQRELLLLSVVRFSGCCFF